MAAPPVLIELALCGDEAWDDLRPCDGGGAPAALAGDDDVAAFGVGPDVDRVVDTDGRDVARESLLT